MTRRVFRPAACEGAAPSFPLVPRSTQAVRRMLPRQHALALAIIAATATLTPGAALAQACARSDDGGLTRFDRPAGVAPGGVYDWPYPDPRPGFIDPYDTRDNTRVEIGNCRVHLGSTEITTPNAIDIDINVTDIFGNGNQSSGGTQPRDVTVFSIDLSNRVVTDPNARSTITIDGIGKHQGITGPGGVAPVTITIMGMESNWGVSAAPEGNIRNGNIINFGDDAVDWGGLWAMGGNGTLNISGGRLPDSVVYGDGGRYAAADLNNPANTFDDVFNISGGVGNATNIHGDSGNASSDRPADGVYTVAARPDGNDTFNISGGTYSGIFGNAGNDTFNISGNVTVNAINGQSGSDVFHVEAGADLSGIGALQGGDGGLAGVPGHDVIHIKGQDIHVNSTSSGVADIGLSGFEDVHLEDGTILRLHGGGLGGAEEAAGSTGLVIDATSRLFLESSGSFGTDLRLAVTNHGVIDLNTANVDTGLNIHANYMGHAGSRILLSTNLKDDLSRTDYIYFWNSTSISGTTILEITPGPDSPGAQTVQGIPVVTWRQSGNNPAYDPNVHKLDPNAFVLAAPITTPNGLWQYRLVFGTNGLTRTPAWVLTSSAASPTPTPSPTPTASPTPSPSPTASPTPSPSPTASPTPSPSPTASPTPSPSPTASPTPSPSPTASPTPSPSPTASPTPSPSPTASPTPSPSPTASPTPSPSPTASPTPSPIDDHLLHPRVSVYAMGMVSAQGLVMDSLGGVSDRASVMAGTDAQGGHEDGLWMRANYASVDSGRGQFSAEQTQFALRAGKDLRNDAGSRTGIMGVLASGKAQISDHVRPTVTGFANPLSAEVGHVRTTLLGVGAYQTWGSTSGGYLDLSGQLGRVWLSNSALDTQMSDSRGWSALVSLEAGRAVALGSGGWSLTPQAQLVASHLRLDGVDDGVIRVDDANLTGYRARLGARLDNAASTGARFYGLANVWHNLTDDAGTTLHGGTDTIVVAPQFSRSWLEAGVGVQLPGTRAGSFSIDLRGQRGLGGDDRRSLGVQAAWRLSW